MRRLPGPDFPWSVIWPALAALRGEGDDHLEQLHEVAGWFDALEPLFP